jgi:stage II sporulation protein E
VDFLFEKAEVFLHQRNQLNKEPYKYTNYNTGRYKSHRMHILTGLRVRYGTGLVAFFAAGFILGRAFLLGELLPFGVALVAAGFFVYRGYALAALIGAVLGLSTVVTGWELAARIMMLIAVGTASLTLPSILTLYRLWLGGLVFAVLVVAGTGYVAITGPTTYDYVKVLFESIFAALLTVAYGAAFGGIRRYSSGQQLYGEQVFCLIILLLSLVAAAGQVRWGMISPGGILASLTVLVAGYVGGAGLGAAAGAVIGVVPGLVFTVSPAALGAFAFAGFLGGLCRGLKRIGVLTGFLLGGTLLTVYLGSGRDIAGLMLETALAGLVFLLLPKVVFTNMQKNMPVGFHWVATTEPAEGEHDSIVGRFKRWESAFEEISRTYDQVSGSLEPLNKDTPWHDLINQVKNMVCHDCVLNKVCWERESQRTLLYMENCFAGALNSGSVTMEDLDSQLRKRCSRPRELVMGINYCFQLWRMQQFLTQRLHESRELVSMHLRGMRGVIENLARELDANDNWGRSAEYYKQCLKQSGIPVAALSLYSGARGCEAEVVMPTCSGKRRCVYDVAPFLNRLTDKNFSLSCKDCVNWENGHQITGDALLKVPVKGHNPRYLAMS